MNYYKDASTKAPVTVFEYKNKEKAPEEKQLRKLPSSRSDMTLIKNANITIENREEIPEPSKQKNSYIKSSVRITSVLQSLVEAEKISFEKTKISRFVDEIPRIELLDWRDISKECIYFLSY